MEGCFTFQLILACRTSIAQSPLIIVPMKDLHDPFFHLLSYGKVDIEGNRELLVDEVGTGGFELKVMQTLDKCCDGEARGAEVHCSVDFHSTNCDGKFGIYWGAGKESVPKTQNR